MSGQNPQGNDRKSLKNQVFSALTLLPAVFGLVEYPEYVQAFFRHSAKSDLASFLSDTFTPRPDRPQLGHLFDTYRQRAFDVIENAQVLQNVRESMNQTDADKTVRNEFQQRRHSLERRALHMGEEAANISNYNQFASGRLPYRAEHWNMQLTGFRGDPTIRSSQLNRIPTHRQDYSREMLEQIKRDAYFLATGKNPAAMTPNRKIEDELMTNERMQRLYLRELEQRVHSGVQAFAPNTLPPDITGAVAGWEHGLTKPHNTLLLDTGRNGASLGSQNQFTLKLFKNFSTMSPEQKDFQVGVQYLYHRAGRSQEFSHLYGMNWGNLSDTTSGMNRLAGKTYKMISELQKMVDEVKDDPLRMLGLRPNTPLTSLTPEQHQSYRRLKNLNLKVHLRSDPSGAYETKMLVFEINSIGSGAKPYRWSVPVDTGGAIRRSTLGTQLQNGLLFKRYGDNTVADLQTSSERMVGNITPFIGYLKRDIIQGKENLGVIDRVLSEVMDNLSPATLSIRDFIRRATVVQDELELMRGGAANRRYHDIVGAYEAFDSLSKLRGPTKERVLVFDTEFMLPDWMEQMGPAKTATQKSSELYQIHLRSAEMKNGAMRSVNESNIWVKPEMAENLGDELTIGKIALNPHESVTNVKVWELPNMVRFLRRKGHSEAEINRIRYYVTHHGVSPREAIKQFYHFLQSNNIHRFQAGQNISGQSGADLRMMQKYYESLPVKEQLAMADLLKPLFYADPIHGNSGIIDTMPVHRFLNRGRDVASGLEFIVETEFDLEHSLFGSVLQEVSRATDPSLSHIEQTIQHATGQNKLTVKQQKLARLLKSSGVTMPAHLKSQSGAQLHDAGVDTALEMLVVAQYAEEGHGQVPDNVYQELTELLPMAKRQIRGQQPNAWHSMIDYVDSAEGWRMFADPHGRADEHDYLSLSLLASSANQASKGRGSMFNIVDLIPFGMMNNFMRQKYQSLSGAPLTSRFHDVLSQSGMPYGTGDLISTTTGRALYQTQQLMLRSLWAKHSNDHGPMPAPYEDVDYRTAPYHNKVAIPGLLLPEGTNAVYEDQVAIGKHVARAFDRVRGTDQELTVEIPFTEAMHSMSEREVYQQLRKNIQSKALRQALDAQYGLEAATANPYNRVTTDKAVLGQDVVEQAFNKYVETGVDDDLGVLLKPHEPLLSSRVDMSSGEAERLSTLFQTHERPHTGALIKARLAKDEDSGAAKIVMTVRELEQGGLGMKFLAGTTQFGKGLVLSQFGQNQALNFDSGMVGVALQGKLGGSRDEIGGFFEVQLGRILHKVYTEYPNQPERQRKILADALKPIFGDDAHRLIKTVTETKGDHTIKFATIELPDSISGALDPFSTMHRLAESLRRAGITYHYVKKTLKKATKEAEGAVNVESAYDTMLTRFRKYYDRRINHLYEFMHDNDLTSDQRSAVKERLQFWQEMRRNVGQENMPALFDIAFQREGTEYKFLQAFRTMVTGSIMDDIQEHSAQFFGEQFAYTGRPMGPVSFKPVHNAILFDQILRSKALTNNETRDMMNWLLGQQGNVLKKGAGVPPTVAESLQMVYRSYQILGSGGFEHLDPKVRQQMEGHLAVMGYDDLQALQEQVGNKSRKTIYEIVTSKQDQMEAGTDAAANASLKTKGDHDPSRMYIEAETLSDIPLFRERNVRVQLPNLAKLVDAMPEGPSKQALLQELKKGNLSWDMDLLGDLVRPMIQQSGNHGSLPSDLMELIQAGQDQKVNMDSVVLPGFASDFAPQVEEFSKGSYARISGDSSRVVDHFMLHTKQLYEMVGAEANDVNSSDVLAKVQQIHGDIREVYSEILGKHVGRLNRIAGSSYHAGGFMALGASENLVATLDQLIKQGGYYDLNDRWQQMNTGDYQALTNLQLNDLGRLNPSDVVGYRGFGVNESVMPLSRAEQVYKYLEQKVGQDESRWAELEPKLQIWMQGKGTLPVMEARFPQPMTHGAFGFVETSVAPDALFLAQGFTKHQLNNLAYMSAVNAAYWNGDYDLDIAMWAMIGDDRALRGASKMSAEIRDRLADRWSNEVDRNGSIAQKLARVTDKFGSIAGGPRERFLFRRDHSKIIEDVYDSMIPSLTKGMDRPSVGDVSKRFLVQKLYTGVIGGIQKQFINMSAGQGMSPYAKVLGYAKDNYSKQEYDDLARGFAFLHEPMSGTGYSPLERFTGWQGVLSEKLSIRKYGTAKTKSSVGQLLYVEKLLKNVGREDPSTWASNVMRFFDDVDDADVQAFFQFDKMPEGTIDGLELSDDTSKSSQQLAKHTLEYIGLFHQKAIEINAKHPGFVSDYAALFANTGTDSYLQAAQEILQTHPKMIGMVSETASLTQQIMGAGRGEHLLATRTWEDIDIGWHMDAVKTDASDVIHSRTIPELLGRMARDTFHFEGPAMQKLGRVLGHSGKLALGAIAVGLFFSPNLGDTAVGGFGGTGRESHDWPSLHLGRRHIATQEISPEIKDRMRRAGMNVAPPQLRRLRPAAPDGPHGAIEYEDRRHHITPLTVGNLLRKSESILPR